MDILGEGCILFCEGDRAALATAFDATASALGRTTATEAPGTEVTIAAGATGVAFELRASKALSVALAHQLARHTKNAVRLFTARVLGGKGENFSCELDELLVGPGGSARQGRWPEDMEHEYGPHWDDLCDGKSYYALSSALEQARATAMPEGGSSSVVFLRDPPSLGSKRLDDIASQIRFAERAELGEAAGRTCVRITGGGSTVISFVDAAEVAALRVAVGPLLREKS